ncbi:MAG: lysylphosphatidylglycerol synthase domain-containing protein [Rhodothermales bacterium]
MSHASLLKSVLQVIVAIASIAIVILWIDADRILDTAADGNVGLVFLVVVLMPVNVILEVLVWRPVVRPIDPGQSIATLTRAVLAGFSLALITPARIGEFYGRTFESERADRWKVAASVLISRFGEQVVIAFGCLMAASVYSRAVGAEGWVRLLFPAAFVYWIALGLVFLAGDRLFSFRILPRRVSQSFDFLASVSLADRYQSLGFAILRYVVFTIQFVLAVRAFGIDESMVVLLSTCAVVFFVRSVTPPVSFLDLGVREGAAAFVFGYAGMSNAAAFNAALAIFGINVLMPALIGIPFAVRHLSKKESGA